jgi:hypothetical protein
MSRYRRYEKHNTERGEEEEEEAECAATTITDVQGQFAVLPPAISIENPSIQSCRVKSAE